MAETSTLRHPKTPTATTTTTIPLSNAHQNDNERRLMDGVAHATAKNTPWSIPTFGRHFDFLLSEINIYFPAKSFIIIIYIREYARVARIEQMHGTHSLCIGSHVTCGKSWMWMSDDSVYVVQPFVIVSAAFCFHFNRFQCTSRVWLPSLSIHNIIANNVIIHV